MMVYHTENKQNFGLVRRPNFEKQETNFVAIYDKNMAELPMTEFNQWRLIPFYTKMNASPYQDQSDKVTIISNK